MLPVGESRQRIKVRGQMVPITHFEHNEGLEKAIEKGFGEMCNYKHCQYGKTCRRLHARNVSGGQTNNNNNTHSKGKAGSSNANHNNNSTNNNNKGSAPPSSSATLVFTATTNQKAALCDLQEMGDNATLADINAVLVSMMSQPITNVTFLKCLAKALGTTIDKHTSHARDTEALGKLIDATRTWLQRFGPALGSHVAEKCSLVEREAFAKVAELMMARVEPMPTFNSAMDVIARAFANDSHPPVKELFDRIAAKLAPLLRCAPAPTQNTPAAPRPAAGRSVHATTCTAHVPDYTPTNNSPPIHEMAILPSGVPEDLNVLGGIIVGRPIPLAHGPLHLNRLFTLMRADYANGLDEAIEIVRSTLAPSVKKAPSPAHLLMPDKAALQHKYFVSLKEADPNRKCRMYNSITLQHTTLKRQCHGIVLEMLLDTTQFPDPSILDRGKRLMHGNLLALSQSWFTDPNEDILFGVIHRENPAANTSHGQSRGGGGGRGGGGRHSSLPSSRRGRYLPLSIILEVQPSAAHKALAMLEKSGEGNGRSFQALESQTFFLPYQRVLQSLQAISKVERSILPLGPALLEGKTRVVPQYLIRHDTIEIGNAVLLRNPSRGTYCVNYQNMASLVEPWTIQREQQLATLNAKGTHKHVLDTTQALALQHIFSHNVAIIQGTPGTGKTFIGGKVLQILLENSRKGLEVGPILVIAQTNHAIDAVLEDILPHLDPRDNTALARIGGSSKNEAIAEYAFTKQLSKFKRPAGLHARGIDDMCETFKSASTAAKECTKAAELRREEPSKGFLDFLDKIFKLYRCGPIAEEKRLRQEISNAETTLARGESAKLAADSDLKKMKGPKTANEIANYRKQATALANKRGEWALNVSRVVSRVVAFAQAQMDITHEMKLEVSFASNAVAQKSAATMDTIRLVSSLDSCLSNLKHRILVPAEAALRNEKDGLENELRQLESRMLSEKSRSSELAGGGTKKKRASKKGVEGSANQTVNCATDPAAHTENQKKDAAVNAAEPANNSPTKGETLPTASTDEAADEAERSAILKNILEALATKLKTSAAHAAEIKTLSDQLPKARAHLTFTEAQLSANEAILERVKIADKQLSDVKAHLNTLREAIKGEQLGTWRFGKGHLSDEAFGQIRNEIHRSLFGRAPAPLSSGGADHHNSANDREDDADEEADGERLNMAAAAVLMRNDAEFDRVVDGYDDESDEEDGAHGFGGSRVSIEDSLEKCRAFLREHGHDASTAEARERVFQVICAMGMLEKSLEMRRLITEVASSTARLEAADDTHRANCLRHFKVIGATTTGCATMLSVMRKVGPKVVIVEEAAEVLESHVISCLSPKTEHLILIGDHKQLQPKIQEEVTLGRHKNLIVSLMERLVRLGAPYVTLTTQRRMHPMISEFHKAYYLDADPAANEIPSVINDHPRTLNIFSPRGVANGLRVALVSHSGKGPHAESYDEGMQSCYNRHESRMALAVYTHLAACNPKATATILVPYAAHTLHTIAMARDLRVPIRGKLSQNGVRISSIDDYQGEEDDFIIVCLTRTTKEGFLRGFLKMQNRACVTLSRAKSSMYLIACAEALEGAVNPLWVGMLDILKKRTSNGVPSIMPAFPAVCTVHNTPIPFASWEERLTSTCKVMCNAALQCGHTCQKICHSSNDDHGACKLPCERTGSACNPPRECSHACTKKCSEKCGVCTVEVQRSCAACKSIFTVPCNGTTRPFAHCGTLLTAEAACGHTVTAKCSEWVAGTAHKACKAACNSKMPCGHVCTRPCHLGIDDGHSAHSLKCVIKINTPHPACGHTVTVPCNTPESQYPTCTLLQCERTGSACNPPRECSHACTKKCSEKCGVCTVEVQRACAACKSIFTVPCNGTTKPFPHCGTLRTAEAACGHTVTAICSEWVAGTAHKTCKAACNSKMPCGHVCTRPCHFGFDDEHSAQSLKCLETKETTYSKCNHPVTVRCNTVESKYPPCQKMCSGTAPCGHPCINKCSDCTGRHACNRQSERRLVCGHISVFACEDPNPSCPAPCEFTHRCGHQCPGTCGDCGWSPHAFAHKPCKASCGDTLVCGHACGGTCSHAACPPCAGVCNFDCGHGSSCTPTGARKGHSCGECTARKCQSKCDWKCAHQACELRCFQPCTRPPCDEACGNLAGPRSCGHVSPCVGLCGEVCPSFCRECFNAHGEAYEGFARFVSLGMLLKNSKEVRMCLTGDLTFLDAQAGASGVATAESLQPASYRLVEMPCCSKYLLAGEVDEWVRQACRNTSGAGPRRILGPVGCPSCAAPMFPHHYRRQGALIRERWADIDAIMKAEHAERAVVKGSIDRSARDIIVGLLADCLAEAQRGRAASAFSDDDCSAAETLADSLAAAFADRLPVKPNGMGRMSTSEFTAAVDKYNKRLAEVVETRTTIVQTILHLTARCKAVSTEIGQDLLTTAIKSFGKIHDKDSETASESKKSSLLRLRVAAGAAHELMSLDRQPKGTKLRPSYAASMNGIRHLCRIVKSAETITPVMAVFAEARHLLLVLSLDIDGRQAASDDGGRPTHIPRRYFTNINPMQDLWRALKIGGKAFSDSHDVFFRGRGRGHFVGNDCIASSCSSLQRFCNAMAKEGLLTTLPEQLIAQGKIRFAYHGTSAAAMGPICCRGFDVKRRSGQRYGPGEYFGAVPEVSEGYAKGSQSLIICAILTSPTIFHDHSSFYVVNNPIHDEDTSYAIPVGTRSWAAQPTFVRQCSYPADPEAAQHHENMMVIRELPNSRAVAASAAAANASSENNAEDNFLSLLNKVKFTPNHFIAVSSAASFVSRQLPSQPHLRTALRGYGSDGEGGAAASSCETWWWYRCEGLGGGRKGGDAHLFRGTVGSVTKPRCPTCTPSVAAGPAREYTDDASSCGRNCAIA